MGQRSKLQDVADAAGVSFITAWRALNQPEKVREKTAEKVRVAAAEVGYVVNSVARSLVTARSGVIGLVVPTLEDSIFSQTVEGLSDTLSKSGREMLIGISHYDYTREEELIRAFVGRRIDALVLTGKEHSDTTCRLLEKSETVIVEIWDVPRHPLDLYVGFSNRALAAEATGVLLAKGYRRIAFVTPQSRARAVERRQGYETAMRQAGQGDHVRVVETAPTLAGGADALDELMADPAPPDAIFFNGDTLAVGAHLHGAARGLRFPQDVAIMGLHDTDIASRVTPPLSTVRIPRYEIGRLAGEKIIARLDGAEDVGSEQVAFHIVERGTT
ncbi:LacI family DNA-binding transcriptional regulator [Mameliella sp.]|uniref:LacI family DNA-binding transcriptional regulator n=1 Tax=Mameliella sp. TaxID=1924940 RepID=UPI003BADBE5E